MATPRTKKPNEQFEQLIRIDEKQKTLTDLFSRHEERDERRFGDLIQQQTSLAAQYNALDKKVDHLATQIWTAVAILSALIPIILKLLDFAAKFFIKA